MAAEKSAAAHRAADTGSKVVFSKRDALIAAATLIGLIAVGGALLWANGGNEAARQENEGSDAMSIIMGRWASTPNSSTSQFAFDAETMTASGQTFPVTYVPVDGGIAVSAGKPPREIFRLFVVTSKELRLEGAATVNLYRIR